MTAIIAITTTANTTQAIEILSGSINAEPDKTKFCMFKYMEEN